MICFHNKNKGVESQLSILLQWFSLIIWEEMLKKSSLLLKKALLVDAKKIEYSQYIQFQNITSPYYSILTDSYFLSFSIL